MANAVVSSLLQQADAFKWQRGVTPLSDEHLMLVVPGAYVAVVLLLRAALRGRTVPLGPLPALHNCVLMLWSLAMFAGTAHEAWRLSAGGAGTEWLFCLPPGTVVAGRLYWWSYVYYVSKARAARAQRRTLRFFACASSGHAPRPRSTTSCWTPCCGCSRRSRSPFCTSSTMPSSWSWRTGCVAVLRRQALVALTRALPAAQWREFAPSLQVIALLTNTGVHVVMYTYYLLCSVGQRPGKVFKLFVTNGQIVQFVFRRVAGGKACTRAALTRAAAPQLPVLRAVPAPARRQGLQRLRVVAVQRRVQRGAAAALLQLPPQDVRRCRQARQARQARLSAAQLARRSTCAWRTP